MGASEKHAATYHGREYTPSLGVVRESFALTRKGPLKSNSGATAYAEFDRMIAKVRAEAKAEALRDAAEGIRNMTLDDNPTDWLTDFAEQYQDGATHGR